MKFGICTLLAMIFSASLGWARPEVSVPSEVEVSNTPLIHWNQVAEFKEFSGASLQELQEAVFVENPGGLDTMTVSGEEISKKLRDLIGSSDSLRKSSPSFRIPSEIRLKIIQTAISAVEVERMIKNQVLARCQNCKVQIRLNTLPKVGVQSWTIDWNQEIKFGSFMIPVQEKDQFSNKWITGNLRVQKLVPVPKKLIRYGERLQAEDLELLESDVSFVKEETPQLEQVIGLIANRTLSPRSPILLSDLKREPAASKGQVVKALVGDQSFEVSVNATAEENGFVGDLIKIKNLETQKTMSATVIEKGVVKVQ